MLVSSAPGSSGTAAPGPAKLKPEIDGKAASSKFGHVGLLSGGGNNPILTGQHVHVGTV